MKKLISLKSILLIFFLISIFLSNIYINKFENKFFTISNFEYPSLYHSDTITYFQSAEKISNDITNGKNILISGPEYSSSFLIPRTIYIFNKFFNNNRKIIKIDENKIFLEKYRLFVILQFTFFYLSLLYFYSVISKSLDKKLANIICLVVALNPIIFQWHLSIMTESIFISMLILLFAFLIRLESKKDFFLIGIFIGLLYLQRTIALLYPFVVFSYIIFYRENLNIKIKKIFLCIFGFSIILFVIGLHNFYRADVFYFTPSQSKTDIQTYIEPQILSKTENLNTNEILEKFSLRKKKKLKDKSYELSIEKERIQFLNKIRDESVKTILNNKLVFSKIILKNYFHSLLLNPVYVYYESKYQYWLEYKNSKDHKYWLRIRIIMTLFFFIFSALGLMVSNKKIDLKLNILIFLSCVYFFITSCWLGNTRYFTPTVLFMSIYFSIFISKILNNIKK